MKYWKIYRDSYQILNRHFNFNIEEWKFIHLYDAFYLTQNNDSSSSYGWMPLYHSRKEGARPIDHSDKPRKDCYDSSDFLKRYNYKYCGDIGNRKQKLKKINLIAKH